MSKQRPRDIIKEQHERSSLEEALELLNRKKGCDFRIIERPDPPDAIISDGTSYSWMEYVDAFRTEDEARELLTHVTPGEIPYQRKEQLIESPDKRIVDSIICKMRYKLGKTTYRPSFEKYGKGILIIGVQDPLFSEMSFTFVEEKLIKIYDSLKQYWLDLGYFREVYLKFRLSFWVKCGLMQIYPTLESWIVPKNVKSEEMFLLEKKMNILWSSYLEKGV